jgi:hypothetical protein
MRTTMNILFFSWQTGRIDNAVLYKDTNRQKKREGPTICIFLLIDGNSYTVFHSRYQAIWIKNLQIIDKDDIQFKHFI